MAIYFSTNGGEFTRDSSPHECKVDKELQVIEGRYSKNPVGYSSQEDLLEDAVMSEFHRHKFPPLSLVKVEEYPDDLEGHGHFRMTVFKKEVPQPGFYVNVLPVIRAKGKTVALFSMFAKDVDTFSCQREVKKKEHLFAWESPIDCAKRAIEEEGGKVDESFSFWQLKEREKYNPHNKTIDSTTGVLVVINDRRRKVETIFENIGIKPDGNWCLKDISDVFTNRKNCVKNLLKEMILYDYEKKVIKEALKKLANKK